MKIVEAFARWLGWLPLPEDKFGRLPPSEDKFGRLLGTEYLWRRPGSKTIAEKQGDLSKFFETHGLCPDCGEKDWKEFQDGGHDICVTCNQCSASFSLQLPPFNLIERIPTPQKVEETA
jgi:hypothetical protein